MQASSGVTLRIGRDSGNALVVDLPTVSGAHAELRSGARGPEVRDLQSTNGTRVGGRRIGTDWTPLTGVLNLGSYQVPRAVVRGWLDQLQRPVSKTSIPSSGQLTLGRDPDSDVVVDAPMVSWNHARLSVQGSAWTLTDLGSANGTFVNGQRVRGSVQITPTDAVHLGSQRIHLDPTSVRKPERLDRGVRLDGRGLVRRLPNGLQILNDVSVSIFPGELVAILGPSGAGKTTLLELLTGRRAPSDGRVLLNGHDLTGNMESLRERIGYVPQEDVMHRDLTVTEVLLGAARLRMPTDLPAHAIAARVDTVIEQLGLQGIRDSVIGGEKQRGISGGQRKRVNIAIELLNDPALLFLDEPTSGLDATSTLEVMQVLRDLADGGTTVIATVHQPRPEAFELLDNVLLLAKGGYLAYYGPAGQASVDYIQQHSQLPWTGSGNPADYLVDALEPGTKAPRLEPADWGQRFRTSATADRFVSQRFDAGQPPPMGGGSRTPGLISQLVTLTGRYANRQLRDRVSLGIQLIQAPIVAGLLWLLFNGARALDDTTQTLDTSDPLNPILVTDQGIGPTLFLLCAAAFWLGCSNVARELVSDRPMYLRERSAGLKVPAYLASTTLVQLGLVALQTLILVAIPWAGVELQCGIGTAAVVLFATGVCGVCLGLLVSSLAPTEVTAISVIPLLLLPQLMLAGYLKPYGEMEGLGAALTHIVPLRWAFEGVFGAETAAADATALWDHFGFPDVGAGACVAALAGFALFFWIAALVRLHLTPSLR